ncbi:hypothetical protein [Flavobacterium sp. NRK1]|uniref:hypothetical protein n=1 Tax=Flavobacterium sp. NRK1 TaxID=2954929 RepID=UPI0020925250|nr:hypothetical protein [Flavobacterium sp. NRK1]MCO6148580.1 hypothetical protein [Flavobacterium sp. NRK1]
MKASLLKALFITFFFASLSSCSNGIDSDGKNPNGNGTSSSLSGSYNIISMMSDLSVDLNNDGYSSNNLMEEIDPAVFDSSLPELEIKPVVYNNQIEDLMSFYLPHSTVTVSTPNKPGSAKFTRNGLGYVYKFDKNTQTVSIEDNDVNQDPAIYGHMESVTVIGNNKLKAVFTKYYYDFSSTQWRLLTITCIYIKF